jgi:hypothetical protein
MIGVNRQLIAFEWVSEQKIEPCVQDDGHRVVDWTVVPRYWSMKVSDCLETNKGGTTTSRPLRARGLSALKPQNL